MKEKKFKVKLGRKTQDERLEGSKVMPSQTQPSKKLLSPSSTERVNTKPWLGKTATEMKALTKKSATTETDPFEDLFADEPDEFDDLFAEDVPTPVDSGASRAGKRRMNVVIDYDPTKITGYSELLMECIAARGAIPEDFSIENAVHWVQVLGNMPAKILAGDEDRWQLFVFSYEFMRLHGSEEHQRAATISKGKVNPAWDETKENVEQDGRTIGGVDLDPLGPPVIPVEGDFGLAHLSIGAAKQRAAEKMGNVQVPVREQVEGQKKAKVEENRKSAAPADLDAIAALEGDPQLQTWRVASEMARKPRAEWEGKVDWLLEQKIKYCYGWLKELGEIPKPFPPDVLDIFWPPPSLDPRDATKTERRHTMTAKVISYWQKSVEKNGAGMDLTSTSYRTTLAAMDLQKAIEAYVEAGTHFTLEGEIRDKEEEIAVQKAAKVYFQSHFPISMLGVGPGPLSTMDPDFIEYVRICRQYKITRGTLLHEVKF